MLFHSPSIVTDGLVLCLDAANPRSYTSGSTTWSDLSGNDYHWDIYNASFAPNNGGCFTFDGSNDYLNRSSLQAVKWQNYDAISIECCFTLDSFLGAKNARQYLFDFRDNGTLNGALACFVDRAGSLGELTLFYNTTGNSYEEPTAYTFSLGQMIFYQVILNKTANTVTHYVNGKNVYNRNVTLNSATINNGDVWIGRFGGGGYFWNGKVFNFKVYTNKALTPAEIRQNFNATRGRFGL